MTRDFRKSKEMQHELDHRADLKRQLNQAGLEADERRTIERRAVDELLRMQADLLALSVRWGQSASYEEKAGNYELAETHRRHSREVLNVRAKMSTQDLFTTMAGYTTKQLKRMKP